MAQKIKIYHNPACETSRNSLALIRNTGQEPEVIEYLTDPPSKAELVDLIEKSNLSVRDAIRKNVEPYENLKLGQSDWSDDQLVNFMLEYPILINRPFVVTELGVKLCRPSEIVLDLLSTLGLKPFVKENGEVIIDENLQRIK